MMWAGNAVVGRMLAANVPPMELNALRWLTAAIVLLPLAWRVFCECPTARRNRSPLASAGCYGWPRSACLQCVAVFGAAHLVADQYGADHIDHAVLTMLIGVVFFDERPPARVGRRLRVVAGRAHGPDAR